MKIVPNVVYRKADLAEHTRSKHASTKKMKQLQELGGFGPSEKSCIVFPRGHGGGPVVLK